MPKKENLQASGRTRVIVIVAYDDCQSLDVTGPWEVFTKASREAAGRGLGPGYRLVLASPNGGSVVTNSGLQLACSTAIADIRGHIDTIIVMGGDTDVFEPTGSAADILPWLKRRARGARRICSVCTGVFALAAAGLLDNRRATTHWNACAQLANAYPKIKVEPDAIYVADPPFYCSAGISSAVDLSLALVEADLGQAVALAVARELVVYLRRPGGQSQFSVGLKAQMSSTHAMRELMMWVVEHPNHDLSVAALAYRISMSERHFSRQFLSETGQTPARFVEAIRLDHAKSHLEQTTWPLARVAQRAGFGSVDSLQRSLRRHAGISPELYRQRFSRLPGADLFSLPRLTVGN
jgi:transcriptional regulator GlxA family with amidase domain